MNAKKYICPDRQNYLTGISVKGKRVFIDFVPKPFGSKRIATFTTSSQEIIDALESDSRFGRNWIAVEEPQEPRQAPQPEVKDLTTDITPEEVNSFQSAKKYLIQKQYCTSGDLSNIESVLAVSKLNNLRFLGWTPRSTPTQ